VPDGLPILIYGNGAMARLVYSYARRVSPIWGFTVDQAVIGDAQTFCGLPITPFESVLSVARPEQCRMLIAIGYHDMNQLRLARYDDAKRLGYSFTSYIDPGFIAHDSVEIGENCIILDHSSVHPGCRIGDSVFISSNVNLGHDCAIGRGGFINAGVSLGGGCTIGDGVFFGVNASAAHGVSIGAHSFIGANTLAGRDTPPSTVLLSEPGQPMRLKSGAFLQLAAQA
jgi:sugar O-acyltransferase (sialic acid O-acetyltransferase NeuD family)